MKKTSNNILIIWATLGWCLLVGTLWYWNWVQTEQSITRIAKAEAYASAGKDIMYHKWGGIQGGVYVRPTKTTPPNPYLSFLPEQNIRTDTGEEFTLINPAYMVRQVNELTQQQTGRASRLTSLHPIRPQNSPDSWEKNALLALSQDRSLDEIYTRQFIDNHDYLRVIRPMYAVKACIRCHNKAGYKLKEDDLRGGISVSVDFLPYAQAIHIQRVRISLAYLLVWLAGLIGLWLWHLKNNQYINELHTREKQLRTLINAAPDLICLKDKDGRWLEANAVTVDIFSLHGIDYLGKTDLDLAAITDSKFHDTFLQCAENDQLTWKAGINLRLEEIITSSDGREKIYDIIKAPIFDKNGLPQGLIVLGRDITEQKRDRAERQMLISAIEQTAETIVVTDRDGYIQYINPACEKNTGYSKKELLGQTPRIFKSSQQDRKYYTNLWNTILAGKVWSGRIINQKKNGYLFTEEMTISPVRNEQGEIVNFVAVKQDITTQINLENEKKQIEEQFQQAQKMESVGRLAGGIAHDLNNLLTPMLGYSELLLHSQDNMSTKTKENVKLILEAGQRAKEIVQRLLSFSRNQPLKLHDIRLNKILCDFEKLLSRTIREDIFIDLLLDPNCPTILADSSRLEQIIMNIAVNSQDAMGDGGVLLIETRLVAQEEHSEHQAIVNSTEEYVLLSFTDTGCGMDKEVLNAIFEPFFTTKEKHKGTGLGLSTVYGLVKQLQGEIIVQSAPDAGTEFSLYFPVVKSSSHTATVITQTDTAKPTQPQNANIMVVEDDEHVRTLIINILETKGFHVISAENGYDALACFEQESKQIDLLISDIVMPKMNGKELYELLRTRTPSLRVVFLSGYAEDVLDNNYLLTDQVRFLQKPFAITDLFDVVEDALS